MPKAGFISMTMRRCSACCKTWKGGGQKTLLIGVAFGLLDFAEKYTLSLHHTVVMETGGMKGRRRELTRGELHAFLIHRLGVTTIHAEYGMTELLSQAYSPADGLFSCPPWMKVLVRSEDDPLEVRTEGEGILNIIDLANRWSCAFLATEGRRPRSWRWPV